MHEAVGPFPSVTAPSEAREGGADPREPVGTLLGREVSTAWTALIVDGTSSRKPQATGHVAARSQRPAEGGSKRAHSQERPGRVKGLETRAMMKRRCHWGLEERWPRGDLIPGCREKTDGYWKPRGSVAGPASQGGRYKSQGRDNTSPLLPYLVEGR